MDLMTNDQPDTCRSCGAKLRWVRSATGRNIPLELEVIEIVLDTKGKTLIVDDAGEVRRGTLVADADLLIAPEFAKGGVAHFASCPEALKWRGASR